MINYGSAGVGSEVIANRLGVGPMHDCLGCVDEEFFLTSYAVGDPAMLVDIPANVGLEGLRRPAQAPPARPRRSAPRPPCAYYPDDPSNVHHSYINDFVKFRNLHTGGEHHIFHLHNHQWLFNPNDDNSNYLDAQAIGPGSRLHLRDQLRRLRQPQQERRRRHLPLPLLPALRPGHVGAVAQPRRARDRHPAGGQRRRLPQPRPTTCSTGKPALTADGNARARALPDGEIVAGTPIPAVVPLPGKALAPLPGKVEVVANHTTVTVKGLDRRPTPAVPVDQARPRWTACDSRDRPRRHTTRPRSTTA